MPEAHLLYPVERRLMVAGGFVRRLVMVAVVLLLLLWGRGRWGFTGRSRRVCRAACINARTLRSCAAPWWRFACRCHRQSLGGTGATSRSVPDLPVLRECPAGYQPLLKPIAAIAGDVVDLTPDVVAVNGEPMAQSHTQEHDRAGRVLPHMPWGRYQLTAGELWVMSTYHPASWDSRYFGPIRAETVIATVVPLWVWPTREGQT